MFWKESSRLATERETHAVLNLRFWFAAGGCTCCAVLLHNVAWSIRRDVIFRPSISILFLLQPLWFCWFVLAGVRLRLKCDGICAETRLRLSAKRTSPFKSTGSSVQSTTGSRVVRISGSNAGYTKLRGSVKGTWYPLHSPVSPSLPLPCVTVCHHISTGLYTERSSCCFSCVSKFCFGIWFRNYISVLIWRGCWDHWQCRGEVLSFNLPQHCHVIGFWLLCAVSKFSNFDPLTLVPRLAVPPQG
jgi:hypothetical protein